MESEKTMVTKRNAEFWERFYTKGGPTRKSSPFAQWCLGEYLSDGNCRLLELGCGNGRDAFTFSRAGIPTLAVDSSPVAVAQNVAHRDGLPVRGTIAFHTLDLTDTDALMALTMDWSHVNGAVNVIYSRFLLHAVPEKIEDTILALAKILLPSGGIMCHEFRTTGDPLKDRGTRISEDERWTDHYRRFLDFEGFRHKVMMAGWEELVAVESAGLSPYKGEDPVVGRLVCCKR